jgi:multicomponent Na+:H+ antiporter subunit F
MNVWMLAILAMMPALAIPALAACRGAIPGRFVALQLASIVAATILVLMSFAFDQSSFIDIPMTLALLSLPGTLVIAVFLERWL